MTKRMKSMKKITATDLAILHVLAALILGVPATADVIRGTTFVKCSGQIGTGPLYQTQTCTGIYGESAAADLGAAAAFITGTTPSGGTYKDQDDQNPDLRGGGAVSTTYDFVILPTGNFDPSVPIPVLIDAFLTTSIKGDDRDFINRSFAEAVLGVSTGIIPDLALYACSGAVDRSCVGPPTVAGTFTVDIIPLATNTVALRANITLDSLFQSSASALADPYIRIDPSFLSTHPEFSLVVSPNVTNSPATVPSAVPEPATAWLLGSLLALAGVVRWNAGTNARTIATLRISRVETARAMTK
jgi:hypothetical protein